MSGCYRQRIVVADEEGFLHDWNEGMPLKDMAKKYDISVPFVSYYALNRLGLKSRQKCHAQIELTGGRWVRGTDQIQRWVKHGQAGA